jgi:hypothetical protein
VRDLEWLLVLVEVDRPGRFHSDLLLSAGALTKGQRRKFVSSFILEPFGMKDRDAEVHQPSETKESTMKSKLSLILPLFVLLAPYVTGCSSGYYLMQLIEEHDGSDWVGGIDVVAIGSDFEGGISPVPELSDASRFPVLHRALRAAGFSAQEVRKVFSQNALRVLCRGGGSGP